MRSLVYALAVLLSASSVEAATYYVATTGNDSNNCTVAQTISTPKATIASGMSCLTPGDTVLVRGGVYPVETDNPIGTGTDWNSGKVRVAAYPNGCQATCETVTVVPPPGSFFAFYLFNGQRYLEFDGINLDCTNASSGCFKIEEGMGYGADHIRIKYAELKATIPSQFFNFILSVAVNVVGVGSNEFQHLTIHGGGQSGSISCYGFYLESNNNLVEFSEMYDTVNAGIQIYNGYTAHPDGNILRDNKIHDITRSSNGQFWGIIIGAAATNTQVYNNLIYRMGGTGCNNCGSAGLYLYNAPSSLIWNNTIYGGGSEGIALEAGSTNVTITNTISYNNSGGNYRDSSGGPTTLTTNLFGTTPDPQFVNAAASNFYLLPTSPAINTGTTVAQVTTDIVGTTRPQSTAYDIGAYEFIFSTPSSTPCLGATTGVGGPCNQPGE